MQVPLNFPNAYTIYTLQGHILKGSSVADDISIDGVSERASSQHPELLVLAGNVHRLTAEHKQGSRDFSRAFSPKSVNVVCSPGHVSDGHFASLKSAQSGRKEWDDMELQI